MPFVRDRRPVVFQCNNQEDLKRALKIAAEFKLNALLAGANEAWRVADVLKRSGAPLLVALDFRPPATSMYATQGDDLRKRAEAEIYPANAAELAKAGIGFALVSGANADGAAVLKNVRAAIKAGLAKDAALRALTLEPARYPRGRAGARLARAGQDRQPRPGQGRDLRRGRPGGPGVRRRGPVQVRGGVQVKSRALPCLLGLWLIVAAAASVAPAWADGASILIKNGTLLTVTKGVIAKGDILVINGVIKQVGGEIAAPPGVRVVDAAGRFVLPGIIDSHTHIALAGTNEGAEAITPEADVGTVINADDTSILTALSGGVTMAHTMHGSANPDRRAERDHQDEVGAAVRGAGGQGGHADPQVRAGRERQAVGADRAAGPDPALPGDAHGRQRHHPARVREGPQLHGPMGEICKTGGGQEPAGEPASRRRRTCAWRSWPRSCAASGWPASTATSPPRRSSSWRWPKSSGSRSAASSTSGRATRSPAELAAAKIGISVFADSWAYKMEAAEGIAYMAGYCAKNGVLVSINSDSGERIRRLFNDAAKTMKYGGLSEDEALRLVTINPAIQLGVDRIVGSLEVGKQGDIAVFSEHPMSAYARCDMTVIEGQVYFDREAVVKEREEAAKKAAAPKSQGGVS